MAAKKSPKSRVKTAKQDKPTARLATDSTNPQRHINKNNAWKKVKGSQVDKFQGIDVYAVVDPMKQPQRKELRSAMNNPYVYRACRIATTFTTGQGYTTQIVPRSEEELPEEQREQWANSKTLHVPYLNKDMTIEEIKDFVDKMAVDMDLSVNLFNGYFAALEQGRCVLALTPLATDDEGNFQLPEAIRLIREEFTERPVVNENTNELEGCRIIGVHSPAKNNILPKNRMIYLMHGFNNELFSDYYGDSKVARIADEANTLNTILNQDYERAAESTWYKPPVYSVPIPPQEFGNEDAVLNEFLTNANDSKGQSIAVTGPSTTDEVGVTVLNTPPSSDIGGLEIIRGGLIKAIITVFGLPGFMLSEGDIGKLGGNANIEEVDAYINQEIRPERIVLENTVEKQYYDNILAILFHKENARDIPIKIKFKFNKPKLTSLMTPDMFLVLTQMMQVGLIDEDGVRDMLGLEELDKETMSRGQMGGGMPQANTWMGGAQPVAINVNPNNLWPDEERRLADKWDEWTIKDEWVVSTANGDQWAVGTPQEVINKWPDPVKAKWSKAGTTLQTAKDKRNSAV
jgi:hypothetical protein